MTFDPADIASRVKKAVGAAGATPWLVGYDANGARLVGFVGSIELLLGSRTDPISCQAKHGS